MQGRRPAFLLHIFVVIVVGILSGRASATTDKEHEDARDRVWWRSFWGLETEQNEREEYRQVDGEHRQQRRGAGQRAIAQVGINNRLNFVDGVGTGPFTLSLIFTDTASDIGAPYADQTQFYNLVTNISYYYARFPTNATTGQHWTDNPLGGTFVGSSSNPTNGFAVPVASLPPEAIQQFTLGLGSAEAVYYALITYNQPTPDIAFASGLAAMVPEPASSLMTLMAVAVAVGARRVRSRCTVG